MFFLAITNGLTLSAGSIIADQHCLKVNPLVIARKNNYIDSMKVLLASGSAEEYWAENDKYLDNSKKYIEAEKTWLIVQKTYMDSQDFKTYIPSYIQEAAKYQYESREAEMKSTSTIVELLENYKDIDAEKQKAFIEEYEKLKASKASEDPIYFGDGVHPTHNTEPHYAWIKKGEDKEIRSNTGRERININGAINIETKEAVVRYDDTLNAQSTIKLLRKIQAKHPLASNIYMIIDNARYYKCHLVKEYLVDSKIKLIFLPPYSPNLNLIERLWKFFRKKVTKGLYHEKFSDFKLACENFFRDLKRYKPELDSLLTENFQIIGARKNA